MLYLYRQIFVLGILSLLHAAYSAAQHRSYLRITEQDFDGLPVDVFIQGVFSLFLSMYGILYLAGDFKEVRAIEELECKSWETLHNTTSFYIFNHRVSLVCFLTIGFLMMSNLVEYLDNTPTEELFVDTSRNKKLQINFDIIVPKISCDYLALDAVDSSGETQLQVDHNIYKRRLNLNGQPIGEPEKSDGVGNKNQFNFTSNSNISDVEPCGSCYGAESTSFPCCNTCEDVQRAYKMKNWDLHPHSIEQCKNGSKSDMHANAFKEGCQIYGVLQVNRVSGSFHIAPGISFSFNNMHVHDVHPFSSSSFNTTHIIRHLSFGQKIESIPGYGRNPLDLTESIAKEGATMFQYYLKIVPTMYQNKDNTILYTNQFSVTKHDKVIAFDRGTSGMPGIFFSYEFSPIMVKFTEKPRLLGHLFTQFLSNISGVFICFWIIDILMYKASKVYNIHKKHLPDINK